MTPEAKVAKAFREEVKKLGGWCIKVSGMGKRGLPDYLVVFPGGRVSFVELKAWNGQLTALQQRMSENLRDLGCDVRVAFGVGDAQIVVRRLFELSRNDRDALESLLAENARLRGEKLWKSTSRQVGGTRSSPK